MKPPYDLIRKYYSENLEEILSRKRYWHDPYPDEYDLLKMFTPIEENTWSAIRGFGLVPFYPQFPIDKYWVDFANPYFKLIIECDGKEFHKDKEKDHQRDMFLKSVGWKVFRISGADCYKDSDINDENLDKENELIKLYLNTVEGLVRSLSILIGSYLPGEAEYNLAQQCLQARCTNAYIELPDYSEIKSDDNEEDFTGSGIIKVSDIRDEIIEKFMLRNK